MKKEDVEDIARRAMNIPSAGKETGEVKRDEVDADDNPESTHHVNTMNYCPNCGTKLQ